MPNRLNKKTPPFTQVRNSGAGTEKRPKIANYENEMRPKKETSKFLNLIHCIDHTNFDSKVHSTGE